VSDYKINVDLIETSVFIRTVHFKTETPTHYKIAKRFTKTHKAFFLLGEGSESCAGLLSLRCFESRIFFICPFISSPTKIALQKKAFLNKQMVMGNQY